jgi:hypothetical protein
MKFRRRRTPPINLDDYTETWQVVFRGIKPVAIFPLRSMAITWIQEPGCVHRHSDTIAARVITFKGIKS